MCELDFKCVARLIYLQLLNCFFTSLKCARSYPKLETRVSRLSVKSLEYKSRPMPSSKRSLSSSGLCFSLKIDWSQALKKKVTVKTVTSGEWNKSAGSQEALIKHRCVRAPRPVWAPVPSLIFIPIPSPSPRPLALSHAGVALEIYPYEMGHSF